MRSGPRCSSSSRASTRRPAAFETVRAKAVEAERDRAIQDGGHYDTASAVLQVGVVLVSAEIVTGRVARA